jgi:antitoxin VapB
MNPQTAKIFMNGRSQAVRLPKEYRFNTSEVYISKQGDTIILSAKEPSWDDFFDTASSFGEDFLSDRDRSLPQERDF